MDEMADDLFNTERGIRKAKPTLPPSKKAVRKHKEQFKNNPQNNHCPT